MGLSDDENGIAFFASLMCSSSEIARYCSKRQGGVEGILIKSHMFSIQTFIQEMLYEKDEESQNHHFIAGLFAQDMSPTYVPSIGHISELLGFPIDIGKHGIAIYLEACKQNRGAQHGFQLGYRLIEQMYEHERCVRQRHWDMTMRMQRGQDVSVLNVVPGRNGWFNLCLSFHSSASKVYILKSKDEKAIRKIALDHNRDMDRMLKGVLDYYLGLNKCAPDDMLIYYMQKNPQKSWDMAAACSMHHAVSQNEKGSAVRAQARRLVARGTKK